MAIPTDPIQLFGRRTDLTNMNFTTIYHWFFLVSILVLSTTQSGFGQAAWQPGAHEAQIDGLLAKMTLEEKIGQMTLFTSDWDQTGPTLRENYREDITSGRAGAIFNAHTAAYNRELQRIAVEETRLGIPLIFGYDVIHGYRTIFPIPLGEAASFDPALMELSARIAGREAAAAGLHWTFAPMVDIARDPRWGRIMEGAGEDVYLGRVAAAARVRGFQGNDLSADSTVVACAKHFAAYGAAQAGRDYHTVDISKRELWSTYLPPFKAAIDAGVGTFMTSFNELDGVPVTGSHYLLTEVLRRIWDFEGFVVTDYTSINEMVPHGVVADEKEAGDLALRAGVDMDMQGAVFYRYLSQSVENGEIPEAAIDEAVRRILRLKYALGLFDDPYRYSDTLRQQRVVFAPAHREAARRVARESMVLLKNETKALPLSKEIRSLAVIGPLADSQADLLGAWHADGQAQECTSLLTGIKRALADSTAVSYVKGCDIRGDDRSGFAAALRAARKAEAIVVAVGEAWQMSGEAASRTTINLPGVQADLVKELAATGKPLVVVLMNGRPLAIPEVAEAADALLETWYAGTEGGPAIADVLFGDYNPSAKLPVSFPRALGQVPIFYAAKNTGRPLNPNDKYTSKYLDSPNTPLFPFGYGLSYTQFSYDQLQTDQPTYQMGDSIIVTVVLSNTGERAGAEVAQLYIRDLVGSVTRPVRELKAFQKVLLEAGTSRQLRFSLHTDELAFWTRNMDFRAEPGRFELYVGTDSNADLMTTFELQE